MALAAPAQEAVTFNTTADVVTVTSDDVGDPITLTCSTTLFINGVNMMVPCSGRALDVQGGAGDDRVVSRGFTSGTTDQVVVTGGAGTTR